MMNPAAKSGLDFQELARGGERNYSCSFLVNLDSDLLRWGFRIEHEQFGNLSKELKNKTYLLNAQLITMFSLAYPDRSFLDVSSSILVAHSTRILDQLSARYSH